MSKLFSFPNPVNETSARIVAGGAVVVGTLFAVTGSGWVLAVLTYGFIARVLTGPTLSPLGRLSTQVLTPLLTPLMKSCLLYTSPSPRDGLLSRMPSSA